VFLKTDGPADVFERQTVDRLAPRLADSFVCPGSGLYTTTNLFLDPLSRCRSNV